MLKPYRKLDAAGMQPSMAHPRSCGTGLRDSECTLAVTSGLGRGGRATSLTAGLAMEPVAAAVGC